jgi:hypothetical protein
MCPELTVIPPFSNADPDHDRRNEMSDADSSEAVNAALAALDLFMKSLNAHDEAGLQDSFNFPHARLASGNWRIWDNAADYTMQGFLDRVSADGWHHTEWDSREVVQAGPDKVHLKVQFSRWRADGTLIGRYPSLWIVTNQDGHWGVQGRSSWAA